MNIAFLGGGNMAHALIGGLLAKGAAPGSISVIERLEPAREKLARQFAVHASAAPDEATRGADTLLIAVKPQDLRAALVPLAEFARGKLVVSIAAGVRLADLSRWLGGHDRIVRSMPNTPALIGAGIAALYAPPGVDAADRKRAEAILQAVGEAVWVEDEALLDPVTAVSGSGPAYFFLLIEAMTAAGEKLGLPRDTATQLTLHTALGAARMATESDVEAAELRRRVTSPNGTTEAAIKTFQAGGFEALVQQALDAAARRSAELAEQLGQ